MNNLNGQNLKFTFWILIISFTTNCYSQDVIIDYPEIVSSFKKINQSDLDDNYVQRLRAVGVEVNNLSNSLSRREEEIKERILSTYSLFIDEFLVDNRDESALLQYHNILYSISENHQKNNNLTKELIELKELIE
ncbi:hypothetical protein [Flammeovirga sp. OC4]|uniref:hypothetical protein n=1 Tax=Flammeovirga sp. OC4 TaxID=1382345 RepID=UPI0012E00BC3|nr:hypothetical protein [Flammeovirga sp. OC4]